MSPQSAEVLNNQARLLQQQGRLDEAITLFRQLTDLNPDMAEALWNLGVALCHRGFLEESFALFRRYAELTYNTGAPSSGEDIPPHKKLHDQEQRDYLNQHGITDLFYLKEGGRVAGRAVNADTSNGTVVAQWQKNQPRMVVIDNLLSSDALEKLQRFCWGSTIWRSSYKDGYLGALPEYGLGSPLLAQIADELRATYPALIGQHPLLQFWGFKYDSRLNGINVHADFAAVNVNFWITPDDANLDPTCGGLKIWDVPAPDDWAFATYNDDVTVTRRFLSQFGAKPTVVPYRCNRAVIFDSNLFHETDQIKFKEGYLNRRINLTFLYGHRLP